jgi:hypothetical protein
MAWLEEPLPEVRGVFAEKFEGLQAGYKFWREMRDKIRKIEC